MAHYAVMDYKEIAKLPIQIIADEDCVLFLWTTFPKIKEGLYVMSEWGFEYKTLGFSWIKTNKENGNPFFGIGYYTKSNCEVCLLGTRGKPRKPITDTISSVVISPREKHSKKPEEVRRRIEQLYGNVQKIELFARQKTPGWDVWGNEVESDIEF